MLKNASNSWFEASSRVIWIIAVWTSLQSTANRFRKLLFDFNKNSKPLPFPD